MTIRIALALLFIVPAAMAYPWDSDIDWWILGIAIGVTLIVFAWWRGLFVTNMIGRRLGDLAPQPFQAEGAGIKRRHSRTCTLTIRREWACRCRW